MDRVSNEDLKRYADGGECLFPNDVESMARELLERRMYDEHLPNGRHGAKCVIPTPDVLQVHHDDTGHEI